MPLTTETVPERTLDSLWRFRIWITTFISKAYNVFQKKYSRFVFSSFRAIKSPDPKKQINTAIGSIAKPIIFGGDGAGWTVSAIFLIPVQIETVKAS